MKIVHIILTSRFAGSERYLVELANEQAQRHDVTVILHRRAAQNRPDAVAHRLSPQVKVLLVGGVSLWAQWQVRRLLRTIDPDVVHAHLSGACRSIRGWTGRALRVATLHIRYKAQQHEGLDALIAIAPWQLDEIPQPMRSRTRQIDNWTQLRPFEDSWRQEVRQRLGLQPNDYLIGAMARLEPSKGMDVLIDAFKRLPLPTPSEGAAPDSGSVRLAIVGSGKSANELRQLAPADVIMPGFVEHPHHWLAAFDVFVTAARSEPFGLVMLEAMASGLPIVASDSEGAQHLQHLIGRALVPRDNAQALSQALQDCIEKRPARQVYDLSAHELSRQVMAIEGWYQESLARRSAQ